VHKPPTLLVYDEVEGVEFLRQGGGVLAASAKTFDLNIRLKNDTVGFVQAGRQAGGRTDGHMDRRAGGQTDRQTVRQNVRSILDAACMGVS
jgi:hypothetical protein